MYMVKDGYFRRPPGGDSFSGKMEMGEPVSLRLRLVQTPLIITIKVGRFSHSRSLVAFIYSRFSRNKQQPQKNFAILENFGA
jgi:hypothetical protein